MLVLESIPPNLSPHAFTIGTLDGVHRGHAALLEKLRKTAKPVAALTFSNHPLEVLGSKQPPLLLTPLPIKLSLLEAFGVNLAIVLPFTQKLASMPYDELLSQLPLSHLILGEGAAFGQGRLGNSSNVMRWGNQHNIPVEYLEKTMWEQEPISSKRIREAIQEADFALANRLLGHPHFLLVPPNSERFSVEGLALPPDGRYSMSDGTEAAIKDGWATLSQAYAEPTILSYARGL